MHLVWERTLPVFTTWLASLSSRQPYELRVAKMIGIGPFKEIDLRHQFRSNVGGSAFARNASPSFVQTLVNKTLWNLRNGIAANNGT
jgi:hypothetical protein